MSALTEFQKLVNNDLYQVFVLRSPCSIPINFATHTWLVCNRKGQIHRYEVLFRKDMRKSNPDHLFVDFFPPFSGINVLLFLREWNWKAELIHYIEGGEDSTAKKMIDLIEDPHNAYPYLGTYHLSGPNSNTYTQWMLDQLDIKDILLPPTAIGKDYHEKTYELQN